MWFWFNLFEILFWILFGQSQDLIWKNKEMVTPPFRIYDGRPGADVSAGWSRSNGKNINIQNLDFRYFEKKLLKYFVTT